MDKSWLEERLMLERVDSNTVIKHLNEASSNFFERIDITSWFNEENDYRYTENIEEGIEMWRICFSKQNGRVELTCSKRYFIPIIYEDIDKFIRELYIEVILLIQEQNKKENQLQKEKAKQIS